LLHIVQHDNIIESTRQTLLVDVRRLRAFVAVAEALNFTRAAEQLGIAQQPLSQQIARLERDLGVRLFERDTRNVAMTEAGIAVYRDALDLIARIEATHRNAQRAARGETGRIVVGAGNYGIDHAVPTILRAFHSRYPGVSIELYEHHTAQQLEALRSGEIDVAFAILPSPADELHVELMDEDGFVLVLANEAPYAAGIPVDIGQFREARFVATPRHLSPGLDDTKGRIFRDAGFTPTIAQYATQISTMLALVSAGVGILLTPAALQSLSRPDLKHVPVATPHRVELYMITRRGGRQSPALVNLCATARQIRDREGWLAKNAVSAQPRAPRRATAQRSR
jgi:DNA-binding transcriptional LysR family regulator